MTFLTTTLEKEYDMTTGHKLINRYEMLNEIGRGVHGKVKLAQHLDKPDLVAIKIIYKNTKKRQYSLLRATSSDNAIRDHEKSIRREMNILQKCQHPNIIQLFEIIDDPTCRKIYMVLEYSEGGSILWRNDQDEPILTIDESRRMFNDVVNGLEYLHGIGIIHRDIKPANLLLTKDQIVKISDFGVSFDGNVDDPKLLLETVGTPAFFAPELCRHSSTPPTNALDIWSLGVTLYCFIFGLCPFLAATEYELFELIPTQPLTFPSYIQEDHHPILIDLLNQLLTKDPNQRINIKQIKSHPWLTSLSPSPSPLPPLSNNNNNNNNNNNINNINIMASSKASSFIASSPSLVSSSSLKSKKASSSLSLSKPNLPSSIPSPPLSPIPTTSLPQSSSANVSNNKNKNMDQPSPLHHLQMTKLTSSSSSITSKKLQKKKNNRQKRSFSERLKHIMTRWMQRKPSPTSKKREFTLRPLSCFSDISSI
ncbi:unnamed protein product [Cunninghamella blakesleeana]